MEQELTSNTAEIITAMQRAVPPDLVTLDTAQIEVLRALTRELAASQPESLDEYERFLGIRKRSLELPEAELLEYLRGKVILVTGGTGCVGSTLLGQLISYQPNQLYSLSRGVSYRWQTHSTVRYLNCDVTDQDSLTKIVTAVKPDIIFHTAAQRSPALAEVEVHRTVTTNIIGTHNILTAAEAAGIPQVVLASTGKALRPYSPEVYTASKRIAEWLDVVAATRGNNLVSASRFTHVIDNSIIHSRLLNWMQDEEAIRLHSPHIAFYVQSARESAQLLLIAMISAQPGAFFINAIADLGWPVTLLDLALGALKKYGSHSPIYFSGYDPGYEEVPFPGLYDPMTAGDVSPLLNAFESRAVVKPPCPAVDTFQLNMELDPVSSKQFGILETVCNQTTDSVTIRDALDNLSWSVLAATLNAVPTASLNRLVTVTDRHSNDLSPVHQRVMKAILDVIKVS